MTEKDFLRYDDEEDLVCAVNAMCDALGIPTGLSLDEIIDKIDIELEWNKSLTRMLTRARKGIQAMRPAGLRREEMEQSAWQTDEAMASILSIISEAEVPMLTAEIIEHCAFSAIDIPEDRVRHALELLARSNQIALYRGGWVVLADGECSSAVH